MPQPSRTVILSSAYLAPVQYYAHLYAALHAVEDRGEHYVKQTYRNRCLIATPTGAQALTVPVVREGGNHIAMRDVRISSHGAWQHLHWNALVSAYDNSPYFEYYADDFRPLYEKPFTFLVDFNEALRNTVLSLLSLDKPVAASKDYVDASTLPGSIDLRSVISPKQSPSTDTLFRPVPYYQVFAQRTGFLPNLSIVDLLFNLGPESRMILRQGIVG